MGKIIGRPFVKTDITGIVRLYNLITGRSRTDEQHAWEWVKNPFREADIWILEDEESHEIVGHHGLIPLFMNAENRNFVAGKTENSILHPKFAGTGIYFIHEQKFFKKVVEKYDFLFTTSGHGLPGKIRKQLGYTTVSSYAKYFLLTNPKGFRKLINYFTNKRKIVGTKKIIISFFMSCIFWFVYFFTRKINLTTYGTSFQIHSEYTTELGTEIDQFWEENKKYFNMTLDRSSHYLKWRIFDNPNIRHTFISMYSHQKKLLGYCILAIENEGLPHGVIVDLVAVKKNETLLKDLIQFAIEYFALHEISYIKFTTLTSTSVLNNVFKDMGFLDLNSFTKKNKSSFLVYLNPGVNEKFKDPDNWYYTHLFTEGFVI